ncbi:MAG: 30S ribosomal protein S16 [Bacteroidetes bacterium]|nr:30S ribosomal protein S16 [Bacteroidota bacterium]MBP6315764.1 30S ribosomal protein S16 [Chitinophagaceae bacterium]
MSVKIRLQRHGAKKRPYYFIVVANSTSRRDGKFIEKLGTYNPLTVPATIQINRDRAIHWLHQGAQPTHTANRILSFKGVLYLKHLLRGVKLGLFDEQTARDKFEAWNGSHEILVADRQDSHKKAKAASRIQPVIKKVEEAPVAVAVEAPVAEAAAEEAEVAAPVAEEAQAPEAPVAETKAEDTEAPAAE